jgi:hypothetical protein
LLTPASPGFLAPMRIKHVTKRFVRESRPEGRGDLLAFLAAFIQPVMSRPAHLALPSLSGSATDDETNRPCPWACDHRSAERYLQRTTIRHGDRPYGSSGSLVLAPARTAAFLALQRRRQAKAIRLSWGFGPFSDSPAVLRLSGVASIRTVPLRRFGRPRLSVSRLFVPGRILAIR